LILRVVFRTRAATLALLANIGVILGLLFGAVAFAGAANPPSPQARAYAGAAEAGYDHGVPPPPVVTLKPAAPQIRPAPEPIARRSPKASPGSLDCLSAAVYYEARGESPAGRAAVAQVVLNRTRRAGYPHSVCGVVYQGATDGACQFSFVCNGAMRGRRERVAWLDARKVAAKALAGHVMAAVGRAISFRAASGPTPRGALRLGGHLFFT
jgi:spore germination cell wall hydrolase CwlJ-like protein